MTKAVSAPVTRAVNDSWISAETVLVNGQPLVKTLARIYDQHNLCDWVDRRMLHTVECSTPKMICSEALV